jgi:predicted O-methyltransferase YrrM
MLAAAANALSSLVAVRLPGASLLPHIDDLRSVTVTVAVAVAEAAVAEGLATVELDDIVQGVARDHFRDDGRVTFVGGDGGRWLEEYDGAAFDLVFADTWPGKFTHLERALELVAPGGTYLVDDLTPQPGWPAGHETAVADLLAVLEARPDFRTTRLTWSSGLLVAVRSAD